MTWQELADAILSMPSDVLDMEARIWLPSGNYPNCEEFPPITSISGFDVDEPISRLNFPSMDVDRGGQWF